MVDKLVKSVVTKLSVEGVEDAKLKIDQVAVKAEELKKLKPEITPQIDSAKALLEARLLREGLKKELSGNLTSGSTGGLIGKLSGIGGGKGGLFTALAENGLGPLPAALTSPAGIAALTAAVGALLPELGGIVAGLSAATAGVGAFGLLALPTFDKIKNAYTSIDAAQKKYNAAVALNKENPTKTNAAAAAKALVQLHVAQEAVGPSTTRAVNGIHELIGAFDKMALAFQPTVMKVFNDGLKIANQLLPSLKAPAQAAGTAIDGLLKQFSKFTQSKDFQAWLKSFDKLIGPSIAAIGHGIGLIITQIGKLITRFSARDVQHALNIFFDTIFGVIVAIVKTIEFLMNSWDIASHNIARTWRNIEKWSAEGAAAVVGAVKWLVDKVLGYFGTIIDGAAKLFGWVPGVGGKLKTAAAAFDRWRASVDGSLSRAQASAERFAASVDALHPTIDVRVITPVPGPGHPLLRAAGGPASGWTLVGERGPELLQTPPGSYVYNNSQTQAMLSGRSGGNSYHITVNVPPGSQREAGRQIVNAIRAFEQGSGHGWRK